MKLHWILLVGLFFMKFGSYICQSLFKDMKGQGLKEQEICLKQYYQQ